MAILRQHKLTELEVVALTIALNSSGSNYSSLVTGWAWKRTAEGALFIGYAWREQHWPHFRSG